MYASKGPSQDVRTIENVCVIHLAAYVHVCRKIPFHAGLCVGTHSLTSEDDAQSEPLSFLEGQLVTQVGYAC